MHACDRRHQAHRRRGRVRTPPWRTRVSAHWTRRARPLLGTLVEVGARGGDVEIAISAGFDVISVDAHTAAVLAAAQELHDASDGAFDVTLGSGPGHWRCDGTRLHKLHDAVQLDLGGIAKGYAVDRAVLAMRRAGCASGWVNAGGDVRVFGEAALPLSLRDEHAGGVRPFATLADGAFATSHFDRRTRSQAVGIDGSQPVRAHVSVAAPECLWADALTKLIALSGDTADPLLARYNAQAWLH
ncbi:MAG: hypothetical protein E6H58_15140 [Betaproteobacteria bacterium]|nr:MAG: hypothetical protein E6H58_15140 [Betaproteobacteria bacterium]